MLFMLLFALGSRANEPVADISTSATVLHQYLDATETDVRAILADARTSTELAPEVLNVQEAPSGSCSLLDVTTRGPGSPMHYRALRCPTAWGWRTSLVSSDDFHSLETEWHVTPTRSGTAVTYRVQGELKKPIPEFLVRRGLERSARATLENLRDRIAAPR